MTNQCDLQGDMSTWTLQKNPKHDILKYYKNVVQVKDKSSIYHANLCTIDVLELPKFLCCQSHIVTSTSSSMSKTLFHTNSASKTRDLIFDSLLPFKSRACEIKARKQKRVGVQSYPTYILSTNFAILPTLLIHATQATTKYNHSLQAPQSHHSFTDCNFGNQLQLVEWSWIWLKFPFSCSTFSYLMNG